MSIQESLPLNRFGSGPNGYEGSYPNLSVPPTYQPYPTQYSSKPPSLTASPDPGYANPNGDWTRNVNIQLPLGDPRQDPRMMMRTPSPTPSERRFLEAKSSVIGVDWNHLRENIGKKEFWMNKKTIIKVLALIVAIVLTVILAVFHDQIVTGLTPAGQWLKSHPGGWLVPVGILFIMSFPPLFGHEIIGLLCGVIWGIGAGFGIVALGTLLGEIANYFVFKYWCTARGQKFENKNLKYACLARVIREGGFKVILAVRYSLIPPHFTTVVFSTVGMSFFIFVAAAVLSLPKQLVTVYLGTIFEESVNGSTKKDKLISAVIIIIATAVTIGSARYISRKMDAVKGQLVYERRKARQSKGSVASTPSDTNANGFYA